MPSSRQVNMVDMFRAVRFDELLDFTRPLEKEGTTRRRRVVVMGCEAYVADCGARGFK